jgi:enamine deaminase RidA (YjgF/YER057c/UK114 family)
MGVSPVPTIQCLNPDTMAKPLAPYSNIARVKASDYLFIAGQIGTDKNGKAPADFEAQCALVFEAIGAALASQGAGFPNIVSFTSYLVHSQDIPKFAAYRAREFPRLFPSGAFPPNTLLVVDRLVREDLLVEVAAVAAL